MTRPTSRHQPPTWTRRRLLAGACGIVAAAPLAPALLACGQPEPPAGGAAETPAAPAPSAPQAAATPLPGGDDERLVTEVPAMQGVVESLQYVNVSARPEQRCDNCFFYTATRAGRGRCQLFPQGRVDARGWCASWQARGTGAS